MTRNVIFTVLFIFSLVFFLAAGISTSSTSGVVEENSIKAAGQSENKPDYIFEEIDPLYRETDVSKLISIKDENDIVRKRNDIISYIWSGNGFPRSRMPDDVVNDFKDDRYVDFENLEKIDKLTISMDFDFESIVYLFHPVNTNGELILYHQGHRGDFILGENTIRFFLKKGFSVMAFSLPLKGMNNQPIVELPSLGKIKITEHNQMEMLKFGNISPIKLFMEPIAVALNYAIKEFSFSPVYMIGISGGGWATTVFSAIDTRIFRSYPVAGTYPIYMRAKRDWGDYEQIEPDLYRIANYLELYILASYGDNKKQFQLLNKYDSCCFAGIKSQLYKNEVKKALSRLGKGEFDVFIDDSHKEHMISDIVLELVAKDIKSVNP
ncbi:hypothetical protein ACFL4Z_03385 [candidate division KSB1 bacterium]